MDFTMTVPCNNCPFRSDKHFPLGLGTINKIVNAPGTFPCHKTVDYNEDGDSVVKENSKVCAGYLILLEKEKQPSQMMRIAERLGLYDYTKLDIESPVYDSIKDCIAGVEK